MTTIYEPSAETIEFTNALEPLVKIFQTIKIHLAHRETIEFTNALEPLGFDHQGDFYPVEFPVEDYEFIEIGKCAIATANGYIAVLNYSIMEYWESFKNSDELQESAIKVVKELEGITS